MEGGGGREEGECEEGECEEEGGLGRESRRGCQVFGGGVHFTIEWTRNRKMFK